MNSATSRLLKEFRDVQKRLKTEEDDAICSLALFSEEDLFKWKAELYGPPGTAYEGGIFEVKLQIPQSYPLAPPSANFMTPIFHPNVHFRNGEVCLDILKQQWTPVWTLESVCRAIVALLAHPQADSPFNCDAGNMLRNDDELAFNSMARMYTTLHARRRT